MPDFYLDWNGDFILTPNGSIQMAVGWDLVRQRIVRNMLTNSAEQLPDGSFSRADYVFDPAYGNNGGELVDQTPTRTFMRDFERRVRAACLAEAEVDSSVPPVVTVTIAPPNLCRIFVGVTLLDGSPGQFSVTLG